MRFLFVFLLVMTVNATICLAQNSRVEDKILTEEFVSPDGKTTYIQNGKEDYALHCADEGRFHLLVKGDRVLDRNADIGRLFVGDATAEFNCVRKENLLSCLGDFPMRIAMAKLDALAIGTLIVGNSARQISGRQFKDAVNRMRPACNR